MKIVKGFKYSLEKFDGYLFRAQVEVATVKEKHCTDIYTDNPIKTSVEDVLLNTKSDDVITLTIVNWTSKEQDDDNAEFINDVLNNL